jgi:hypothetical protein
LFLNVHVHALVLDGVFARSRAGTLNFHSTRRLTALDAAEVLATVEPRIKRLLERRGLEDGDDSAGEADAWAEEAPVLAGLAAASVQGTVALGPIGARAFVVSATRPSRSRCPRPEAVTHGRTVSICMRASSCLRGSASGSSACAGTPCVRRWRETACA